MNLEEHTQLLKQEVDQLLLQSTFQSLNKQKGWTNAVLVKKSNNSLDSQENLQFYLPGYLRLKVKNFVSINLLAMESKLNCSILFSFYYGSLPEQLIDLFKDKIEMNLIRNSSFPLSSSIDCKVIQQKQIKLINYVLRKSVSLSYYPYIDNFPFSIIDEYDGSLWFSPYQMLSQVLTIQISKTTIKKSVIGQQKWENMIKKLIEIGLMKKQKYINEIRININLMDYQTQKYNRNNQLIYSQRKDDSVKIEIRKQPILGKYGIATKKLQVHYTNLSYLNFLQEQRKQKQIEYRKQHCLARLIFKDPKTTHKQSRKSTTIQQLQILQKNNQNPQLTNQQTERKINLFVERSGLQEKDKQEKARQMLKKIHFQQKFENQQVSFVNAHFILPIYRYPLMPLLTIFIPLWLLAIQNLGIYLTSTSFSYRLGTLVGIIFANIALIPSYKSQLPPYPGFLLIQLFIYAQQISILLCLIQSFYKRFENIATIAISDAGPLFFVSLGLNGISLLMLSISYIIYKCHWEKTYVYSSKEQEQYPVRAKFLNYFLWNNSQCDKHFTENDYIFSLNQLIANNKKSQFRT